MSKLRNGNTDEVHSTKEKGADVRCIDIDELSQVERRAVKPQASGRIKTIARASESLPYGRYLRGVNISTSALENRRARDSVRSAFGDYCIVRTTGS